MSVWPLCPGLHTRYNGRHKRKQHREVVQIPKTGLSSDCRLQPACMKTESLVITHQLWGGECVPRPCTHRPSNHGSWEHLKARESALKVSLVTGVKSKQGSRTGTCGWITSFYTDLRVSPRVGGTPGPSETPSLNRAPTGARFYFAEKPS